MDLLRKYMMSTAMLRSPDEPAATPPEPDTNALDATPAAAAGGDPPEPEPPGDPEPPAPREDGRKNPWYLKRISDEAEARRQAEEDARQARQEAADAKAIAARLQAGDTPPPAARAPAGQQDDFQTAVRNEALRQRLFEDTMAVKNAGLAKFSDFNDTLGVLNAIGATNNDFVMDVLAVDKANAHAIFDRLAKDPEKAASLVGMDSRRRTAELTRMSMTAAAEAKTPTAEPAAKTPDGKTPPARQVSRAPAPPPPIEPSTSTTKDWRRDDATDAEFDAGFKEQQAKRSARR